MAESCPIPSNSDGSRMYIHDSAFAGLALASETQAAAVGRMLAAVSATRMVRDNLDQMEELGVADPFLHATLEEHMLGFDADRPEHLLKGVGYMSREKGSSELIPVFGIRDRITGVCKDGGYWTFALNTASAVDRMRADTIPWGQLKAEMDAGLKDHRDLVRIDGTNVQKGIDGERLYDPLVLLPRPPSSRLKVKSIFLPARQRIMPAEAKAEETLARMKYRSELVGRIEAIKNLFKRYTTDPEWLMAYDPQDPTLQDPTRKARSPEIMWRNRLEDRAQMIGDIGQLVSRRLREPSLHDRAYVGALGDMSLTQSSIRLYEPAA